MSFSFTSLRFHPRLLDCLRGYRRGDLLADINAGLTVGVVALPLAMAFAIASGVKPEAGLYTAVIAGFLISAFGGCRLQIGGPTGAFVIIVYGILAEYGAENLAVCTMMAGVILMVMGFSGMGTLIKFIPYPVTMGFTSGIAVLIFSTQIKDFLGLEMASVPAGFLEKMLAIVHHLPSLQPSAIALSVGSLLILWRWPGSWSRRIPASIVVLVVGTIAFRFLQLDVETIGTRFGGIPASLPKFHLPAFDVSGWGLLIKPATTIALLAAIESLLSAVVADGMTDDRHDSNQELIAQGMANFISPLFGGIPATGAIARTATNVRSGGRSPVAGIIHAATLLTIMLIAAPMAQYIPLASLSAILVLVAFRMGEWHHFARLRRWPGSDAAVFLTSFFLTVLVDLTVAVEVGMVLASVLFIKRVADSSRITQVDHSDDSESGAHSLAGKDLPPGVLVFQISGSFSFGVADQLETSLKQAGEEPAVLILRMRRVLVMDATGLNALENLHEKLQRKSRHLLLVGPHAQPLMLMQKAGFLERIGRENLCGDLEAAIVRAGSIQASQPL